MKRFNKLLCILAVSASFLSILGSCGSNSNSSINTTESNVTSISIEGPNNVGLREYITLVAKSNDAEQKVNWSSSDKSIATISSAGIVKGIAVGKATITATLTSNENVTSSIEIDVHETMQLGVVLNRFIKSESYHVSTNGSISYNNNSYEMKSNEYFYKDSYNYISNNDFMLPSYGIGIDKEGAFLYNVENNSIISATYLRSTYYSYTDVLIDITDFDSLGVNFQGVAVEESNTYTITNTSVMGLFFYCWTQNINTQPQDIATLKDNIAKDMVNVTIEITSPYSFIAYLYFKQNVNTASLSFDMINEDKENTLLNTYLKDHEVTYPEVEPTIKSAIELTKNHNYIRELGKYTKADETQIDIGKVYFTNDAVFYDFNEDYIKQINKEDEIFDYGYININGKEDFVDGVYYFTTTINDSNEKEVKIGKRITEKNLNGQFYTKYYDYIENITLIFEYMEGKEYTFTGVNTSDYKDHLQFYSDCFTAQNIGYSLFKDEVIALDATPAGMILAIKLDDEASNSVMDYGIYMTISGLGTYLYSNYVYTGFNSVSLPFIDQYLDSIK